MAGAAGTGRGRRGTPDTRCLMKPERSTMITCCRREPRALSHRGAHSAAKRWVNEEVAGRGAHKALGEVQPLRLRLLALLLLGREGGEGVPRQKEG